MGVSFMPIKGVVSEVFTASERHSAWTTRIGWIAISGRLRGVVEEDVGFVLYSNNRCDEAVVVTSGIVW